MASTLDLVKERENDFQPLYTRMDNDARFLKPNWYVLKDTAGKKIKKAISINPNDPKVFAHAVVNTMLMSAIQTRVEGLSDKENAIIEEFLEKVFAQADERLRRKTLFSHICNHIAIRGHIGTRFLTLSRGGKEYIPGLWLLDMRYVSYDEVDGDLQWIAPHMNVGKAQVESEYGVEIKGKFAEVVDYWDWEKNEVWVDSKLVVSQANPYGYPPFVIQSAPTGFMLLDEDALEYEGESIFSLDREMYDELARILSIEATLAMKTVLPAYQKETEYPDPNNPPPYPDETGTVTEVQTGQRYNLLQVSDINQASRMAHADIMAAVQRGSLSELDYGNLTFPLSAVAISDMTEIRNKILIPRLQAIALFYQQLSRLIINQFINGKFREIPVGKIGNQLKYSASDLKNPDDYSINYRYLTKTKRQEIANLSMAVAAKGTIPRDSIIRDILQYDRPDEVIAQLDAEEAAMLDPAVKLYRIASSLLSRAEKNLDKDEADRQRIEARLMGERAVEIIKQRKVASIMSPTQDIANPATSKANTNALIPLMSEGGGRTGGDQSNNKERYVGSQV